MKQTKRQISRPGKRAFFVECDIALATRIVRRAKETKPQPMSKSAWIRLAMIEKLQREDGK